jgi:hypothetical protein
MSDLGRASRWQFSLRWLLVAVTIVAIVLAIGVHGLLSVTMAFFLRGLLPTVALICAIYARGDIRAFAIGAVIALFPVQVAGTGSLRFTDLATTTFSLLLMIGLCGVVAVAVRRWLVSHGLADEN